ncbi:hypothetical protein PFICI_13946 [Pestalotiopsis fici W106-1]|uniref:Carboxylic ester hydrolase n=1 Tax=Pestalotiopsis fici (strain W106-1 / CGMCC3.15140) TaxID=1229662 RepID=W3WJH4_PESFW|nr:uncharacterized protein PFICI_13946 [Pestalotiopsis fici W106-1]ETS74080.1 hypothetical protein PFICI_13946 [Pestalotiopsis fici W106-1]
MRTSNLRKLWLLVLLTPFAQASEVVVSGANVEYRGVQNDTAGTNSFYGIRYAKAPVSDLRWRAPVPIKSCDQRGSIDARQRGPMCLQSSPAWAASIYANTSGTQDEDCLLLDIVTPISAACDKLPVMVQIHGGGYVGGSSSSFPGASIVNQAKGTLIYVAIQYRLGPLGFLAGDEIAANGSWNVGLLDQRAALDWVQQNIHFFGGDPEKVTITGGSAGGGSVSLQMTMYGGSAPAPFRAAIPEYPWWTPMLDQAQLNKQYETFVQAANCTSSECLRKAPLSIIQLATNKSLETAYNQGDYAYGTFYWGPTVDGHIIQEGPLQAFSQGHFQQVPVLIDRDGNEGFSFSNVSITTTDEVLSDLERLWPNETFLVDALELYPNSTYNASMIEALNVIQALEAALGGNMSFSSAFVQRDALFGNALVNCPTEYMALAASRAGVPTYKMIFDAGLQLHGATGPYLFSDYINPSGEFTYGPITVPGNDTLAVMMRDYFISFAVALDPNKAVSSSAGRPQWSPYNASNNETAVLLIQDAGIKIVKDLDVNARCNYLESSAAYMMEI